MSESYYNTTNQAGNVLAEHEASALTQEEKILELFVDLTPKGYENLTPFDVQNLLFHNDGTPITSIRRAMTNLSLDNKLVKTDIQRTGAYGRLCHAWRLA